ncbi:dipeptide transporter [compost metagenome]
MHLPEPLRSKRLQPPVWLDGGSWTYPLGTDKQGRDILTPSIERHESLRCGRFQQCRGHGIPAAAIDIAYEKYAALTTSSFRDSCRFQ